MENSWKDALYFAPGERRGILLIFSLALLGWHAPDLYLWLASKPPKQDFSSLITMLDSLRAVKDLKDVPTEKPISYKPKRRDNFKIRGFPFDPNKIPKDSILLLGVPGFLADRWIKYRNSGAEFRSPEDLKKLYGLQESLFLKLKPFIRITTKTSALKAAPGSEKARPTADSVTKESITPLIPAAPLLVQINSANAEEFQELYGIGPVLSKRILKFREALGGFHSLHQIAEVFGIPDSTYQAILPALMLDSVRLRGIELNQADAAALASHPYIDYKSARILIKYRQTHGSFTTLRDLKKVKGIQFSNMEDLIPYLSFSTSVDTLNEK